MSSSQRHDPRPTREEIGACGARLHELRRYRYGELGPLAHQHIADHIAGCERCRERLEIMKNEEQRFLANTNVQAESVLMLERLERERPQVRSMSSLRRVLTVLIPVGAGAVLLALVPRILSTQAPEPTTRIKGAADVNLEMFVNDPHGARRAADGEILRQGDQIQFRYRAGGRRYVFVVSVTGHGALEPLYPDAPKESIPVDPKGTHVLEGSVILDDTRGPERIFAFFSDRPLPYEAVKRAVEEKLRTERDITGLRDLDLGREDVEEATVLIYKE